MTKLSSVRLQAGIGSHVKRRAEAARADELILGRVISINYRKHTVTYLAVATGSDNSANVSASTKNTAMLPMSMAGRNGYGKAYGSIIPIRVNDIVLIGFVNARNSSPIVIARYPDETIASELSRVDTDEVDPRSILKYAMANTAFTLYPDQTYDLHDGHGNRVLTFSGKSFLLFNSDIPKLSHYTDDGEDPKDYTNLPSSFFGNGQLIEPIADQAPEVMFKHQGIVDNQGNQDNHQLYLYISQGGNLRVSEMQKDQPWRTYFEENAQGEIRLRRQEDSKDFASGNVNSEISIDRDGQINLVAQGQGLTINKQGIYRADGTPLPSMATIKNDIQVDSDRISSVDKRVDGLSVTVGNNTENISKVDQKADEIKSTAGSKNKNYYSTTKPAIADEGDNLFLNLGNGSFEYWVWHNHQWEFIQSTQDLKNVEQIVKEQESELEKVKKSANDVNSKVDNLHHDTTADIALIKTSLKNAQDDIVNTKNDIQVDIANTQSDLANAKSDIVNAKKDIQANGGRISSIDKRVDGLSVTVGNNTGNISKVDQKADEIKSIVASNTENISKVDQKADGIKSIVASNTENISAVDQKADGIKSIVENNTKNISAVDQKADGIKSTVENNTKNISAVDQKADEIKSTVENNTENISAVDQKADEIKSIVANNTENISTITQAANNVSSIVNDKNTGLSAVLQKVDSVSSIINDKEHGLSAVYQKADSLATEIVGKADTSQLIQLSDQINLRVSKGDVLGQINIEAGSTLIQNKKLYLDADSVVFSGKAFIPDAAITDISADKITAGTLDAGKINVINLNADDVTSGILNGANSYFDLNNGVLNVRNSKDESVFLKDGNVIFSAVKKWQGYSDIYGEITMNTTESFSGASEGMLDISSKNGFAIRDQGIEMHDNTSDKGWEFSGEGAIIRAYSPETRDATTGHSLTSLELNAYDTIRMKTGKMDTDPLTEDWNIPLLTLSGNEGVLDLTSGIYIPGIYMQGSQVEITTKNFVVTLEDDGESTVYGNFTVTGSKNAIVPTSKGMAAINSYETAEYYFGDIGKAKTDENGQVIIQLDPLFLETVNTSIPYHVFISSYGNATVWAEQMDRNSFLVKSSKPNIKFSWEIKAKRLGYENNRLKITQKGIPKKLVKRYREKGIL